MSAPGKKFPFCRSTGLVLSVSWLICTSLLDPQVLHRYSSDFLRERIEMITPSRKSKAIRSPNGGKDMNLSIEWFLDMITKLMITLLPEKNN